MDAMTELPGDASPIERPRLANGRYPTSANGRRRERHDDSLPVQQAPPDRPSTRAGKIKLVSLDQLDGRTAAAKEARQLIATLSADLGNDLSVGEQQLVTRAAMLGAIMSDFEARWVAGEQMPLMDYLAAVNVQRRVLATLHGGLPRRSRDVTPPDPLLYAQQEPAP
jgi:hypothetical protein